MHHVGSISQWPRNINPPSQPYCCSILEQFLCKWQSLGLCKTTKIISKDVHKALGHGLDFPINRGSDCPHILLQFKDTSHAHHSIKPATKIGLKPLNVPKSNVWF